MKTSASYGHLRRLLSMLALGMMAICLASCGDDNEKEYTPPSSTNTTNRFRYDGERWNIKSAAYFYNTEKEGYNVVLSDSTEALTKIGESSDYSAPKGNYFIIDMPKKLVNTITGLNGADLDGEKWAFRVECNSQSASFFSSGTLSVNIANGYFTIKLLGNDNAGVEWYLSYEGRPTQSFSHIYGIRQ